MREVGTHLCAGFFCCPKAGYNGMTGWMGYGWVADTVSGILDKQEYCGDTVNFRTYRKSFKMKKKLDKPKDEWKIFLNTHPAIIDREVFALVQELRRHRRRPAKSGIVSMFSGLLYCADCGEKLYYSVTNNYKREQAYFFCSAYRKNSEVCSAHYIREKVVEQLVLESMQRVLWYVQSYEKLFAQRQLEEFGEKRMYHCKVTQKPGKRLPLEENCLPTAYIKMYRQISMNKVYGTA